MYDVDRLTRLKSYELGGMNVALRDWHDDARQHLRALESDDEVDAARGWPPATRPA